VGSVWIRRGLAALALALGLPGGSAVAQDAVPEASEFATTSYAEWGFVDRSPRPGRRFTDVAVHPTDPALVLAVTAGGTGWLSADGGMTWFPVLEADATRLGGMSTDEDVRQEVDAEVDDVMADEGLDDIEEVMSDEGVDEQGALEIIADRAQETAEDVASQVQSELEANPGFLLDSATAGADMGPDVYRPRAFVGADDRLFIARGDGMLVSSDLGATWDMVLEAPVNALATLPDGTLVAATLRGFHTSRDGVEWQALTDRTEAIEVYDVLLVGDRVWAATSDGLRSSANGRVWDVVGLLDGHARALAVDPSNPLTVWAAFDRTVFTTHDGGVTFEATRDEGVQGAIGLLWVGTGHVLATGPGGPYESVDGGATWSVRDEGLHGGASWTLTDVGGRVWLASDDGLARLEPPEVMALRAAALGSPPEFVGFDSLITASLDREGVGETVPKGAHFAATALPHLEFEGRYISGDGLAYLDSTGTTQGDDGVFTLVGRLKWVPAGRASGTVDVLVSDGEVIVDSGGDQRMLAARMDRRAVEYQRKLAEIVTELYYRRAVLVAERALKRSDPLVVRVAHEIAIQEVEARLDVFTDGAVTAWRAGRADQE